MIPKDNYTASSFKEEITCVIKSLSPTNVTLISKSELVTPSITIKETEYQTDIIDMSYKTPLKKKTLY